MNSLKCALSLATIYLCLSPSFAQESAITLEKIWKQNTFSSESVSGIRSLKDGKHYTSIGRDGNGQFLVKYAYETGLAVDTIFSTNDI
ncbi:MAG: S9 family peptidase, partial [Flavobacteriales bacterium]|nr:S9 family peptidase [Flavobacteriales bacterium]